MRLLFFVPLAVLLAVEPTGLRAAELALGGHCPVCLYAAGKLIPGKAEYQAVFDRQTFQFPGEKERKMFQAEPAKYAPALGGDCAVCFVEMGVREPGKPEFAHKHQGRLYLFPGQKQLDKFKANPDRYASADVAYSCFCAVCLLDGKQRVVGKAEFVSTYDGLRYFFPDADAQRKFEANPSRYAPALGGNCVVCLKDGGKHVRGSLDYGAFHDDRAYLFPDEAARKQFLANPARYADADLAHRGNCVVCQVVAGKQVPGAKEHLSVYKGRRYLFPGQKEKEMFDADPARFAAAVGKPKAEGKDNAGRPVEVTVVGRTACAGCEFGRRPVTSH